MEKEPDKENPGAVEGSNEDPETSLDREIAAGEWQRLREFASYRKRTRQGKILAMYQAVSNRLTQLSYIFMQLVRGNPTDAQKMLTEIKKLRQMQDFLSECLIWEKKGEKLDLPDELSDILES